MCRALHLVVPCGHKGTDKGSGQVGLTHLLLDAALCELAVVS